MLGRLLEVLRTEDAAEVTDEQVAQAYQSNLDSFKEGETFRASHILVLDEKLAKSALKRIKEGEAFADVAAELSTDPTRTRGGDVGFFKKGQLIPEFELVAMKLEPGELSDVVKTSLGYHVILLTEHRLERQLPLEEVQDQIRVQLKRRAQQQHVEVTLQGLRADAKIDIREESSSTPAPVAGGSPPPTQ